MSMQKSKIRSSTAQINAMIKYMTKGAQSNKYEFDLSVNEQELGNKEWKSLAEALNKIGPAVKSISSWKVSWRDLKRTARMKQVSTEQAQSFMSDAVIPGINESEQSEKHGCYLNRKMRSSNAQISTMVEYMSRNRKLARGEFFTPQEKRELEQQWVRLAAVLNKMGPAVKNVAAWKVTWRDLTRNTRKKQNRPDSNVAVAGRIEEIFTSRGGDKMEGNDDKSVEDSNDRSEPFQPSDPEVSPSELGSLEASEESETDSSPCPSDDDDSANGKPQATQESMDTSQDAPTQDGSDHDSDVFHWIKTGEKKAKKQCTNTLDLDHRFNDVIQSSNKSSKMSPQRSNQVTHGQVSSEHSSSESGSVIDSDIDLESMRSTSGNEKLIRCTKPQMNALVNYMCNHPNLARSKINLDDQNDKKYAIWRQLTKYLNKMGPARSTSAWKRTWKHLKQNSRRKERNASFLSRKILGIIGEKVSYDDDIFGTEYVDDIIVSEPTENDMSKIYLNAPSPLPGCCKTRPTNTQIYALVNYISKHPALAACYTAVETHDPNLTEWRLLARYLNRLGTAKKSTVAWKRTWRDIKSSVVNKRRPSTPWNEKITEKVKEILKAAKQNATYSYTEPDETNNETKQLDEQSPTEVTPILYLEVKPEPIPDPLTCDQNPGVHHYQNPETSDIATPVITVIKTEVTSNELQSQESSTDVNSGHMSLSTEVNSGHMSLSTEVYSGHMSLSTEVYSGHMSHSIEPNLGHMSLSTEVNTGYMPLSTEVNTGYMPLSTEVNTGYMPLSTEVNSGHSPEYSQSIGSDDQMQDDDEMMGDRSSPRQSEDLSNDRSQWNKAAKKTRCTNLQLRALTDYMCDHPDMALYNLNTKDAVIEWRHLTRQLNRMGTAAKSTRAWKRTWRDIKKAVRRGKTGGGLDKARERKVRGLLGFETGADAHNVENSTEPPIEAPPIASPEDSPLALIQRCVEMLTKTSDEKWTVERNLEANASAMTVKSDATNETNSLLKELVSELKRSNQLKAEQNIYLREVLKQVSALTPPKDNEGVTQTVTLNAGPEVVSWRKPDIDVTIEENNHNESASAFYAEDYCVAQLNPASNGVEESQAIATIKAVISRKGRPRKNKTKEEKLQQKRIAERLRYEKLRNDPKRREELKEKERKKYRIRKEKEQLEQVNLVTDMADDENSQE